MTAVIHGNDPAAMEEEVTVDPPEVAEVEAVAAAARREALDQRCMASVRRTAPLHRPRR